MENFFLNITILFLSISAAFGSFQHIFSRYTVESVHKKTSMIHHSNLVVYGDETCQIIKKYSVAENNTLDCFDENLMIVFEIIASNRSKVTYNGFLQPNNKFVFDKQTKSEYCKKIKRFFHKSLFSFS